VIDDSNSYDHFDFNQTEIMMRLGKLGRQLGLVRLFYQDSTLPSSSTKKKAIYRAIVSKNLQKRLSNLIR
jgi:hypothetical protein